MAKSVTAGASYFVIVFAFGFVLGTVRTILVAPQLGELVAVLMELPIILTLSWLTCGWIVSKIELSRAFSVRVIMSVTAFSFLMIAEISLSVFAFGNDLSEHFATLASTVGAIGLLGQMAFAAMPLFR